MVKQIGSKVEIVACPTIREKNGVAMSSRNLYLSDRERRSALSLYRSLQRAASLFNSGERRGGVLAEAMLGVLNAEPGVQVDYAQVVDARTLEPIEEAAGEILCAVAGRVGKTRLIDNILL